MATKKKNNTMTTKTQTTPDDSPGAVVQPPHVKDTSGPETAQQRQARLAARPVSQSGPGGIGPGPGAPAPHRVDVTADDIANDPRSGWIKSVKPPTPAPKKVSGK